MGGREPGIEAGLNSEVADGGAVYHVQTQCSRRDAPVVESLVYRGGQVLVRMTASFAEIAARHGFTPEDGRRLLEAQHADLLRKIRCGMLREGDAPRGADRVPRSRPAAERPGRAAASPDVRAALDAVDDPDVRALLRELGADLDRAGIPPSRTGRGPRLPWYRRLAAQVRRSVFRARSSK